MKSNYMKAVLCCHFRYKRGIGMIATEAGRFSSDVLLVSKKEQLVEVEIKTSRADFNADFKKDKHRIYNQVKNQFVPHYFYFAIPASDTKLVKYVGTKLQGKPYGIILINEEMGWTNYQVRYYRGDDERQQRMYSYEGRIDWIHKYKDPDAEIFPPIEGKDPDWGTIKYRTKGMLLFNDRVKIVKKAQKIHNRPINDRVKYEIVQRMGSEIAALRRNIEIDKKDKWCNGE